MYIFFGRKIQYYYLAGYPTGYRISGHTGYPAKSVSGETLEKTLPRDTRSQLSRLQSDRQTAQVLSRIDPRVRDECPECGCTPHDTAHVWT